MSFIISLVLVWLGACSFGALVLFCIRLSIKLYRPFKKQSDYMNLYKKL